MRVFALAVILILASSCGRARETENPTPESIWDIEVHSEAIENSGRKLSGEYIVEATEEDYGETGSSSLSSLYRFNEDGGFQRERLTSGGARITEGGGYILGMSDEFVLYVERVGDNALQTARVERYSIEQEDEWSLRIRRGSGIRILLRRK